MCQNCALWLQSDQQCYIHSPDVVAAPEAVCGYHVFGRPYPGGYGEDWWEGRNIMFVTPELSGLETVPGGTSCDICIHYSPTNDSQGTCQAVTDPETGTSATVEPLGCCTRWEDDRRDKNQEVR